MTTTPFRTILQVADLQSLQAAAAGGPGGLLVLDCTFDLADPDRGLGIYHEGHVPGARYLDLERDLSGSVTGTNGRHPLPERDTFAATMRRLGLRARQQVVLYDGNGAIFAARAWWMLRWLGHADVAVLDGGRQAWSDAGLPLQGGAAAPIIAGDFTPGASLVGEPVTADDLVANLDGGVLQVIDARDAARFAGGSHPLDTVAGHIPSASNRPYGGNLDERGRFRDPVVLAQDFGLALAGKEPAEAVLQCGSGVTACHNALAMEIAGLPGARLYPGSWSEWTADPARPIAR